MHLDVVDVNPSMPLNVVDENPSMHLDVVDVNPSSMRVKVFAYSAAAPSSYL